MSQELTNSPQELKKEGSKSKETKKDRRIQKRANPDEMEHSTMICRHRGPFFGKINEVDEHLAGPKTKAHKTRPKGDVTQYRILT